MLDADLFLAFLAAALVFAFMPGPALLYCAAQTVARGRRAGLMAALGLGLGGMVHVLAATLGLSAIFRLVPEAYLALKLVGAAYLLWLGWQMIRGERGPSEAPRPAPTPRRAFLESVTVEVLNPKTALFFVALLPQFTDPGLAAPVWLQFLLLGTICNLLFSTADLLCVAFAGEVVSRMKRAARAERIGRLLGGTMLGALGLKLALERG
ncbi:LysE family translocator [Paralimibaculum aggregatum]|uniref:LysE family translocator n=1 Tax=Paralimibaculum aggregatum TaxID=3036245 RepID=A0ABQ6LK67_9RHOB|nr:LysE family translocator [Limibaculum sp. NKW23]GMG81044.1 LysE family translocator [Limibaculum sp. NKW23]